MHEAIVIGGGPAGITAGIYLARRKFCTLILYEELGGQASKTADIENYSGFRLISGPEFADKLKDHLDEYDIKAKPESALKIKKTKTGFEVHTKENIYKTKSIIFASGSRPRKLKIPGEEEFLNKGVAYCATCDAPLFNGKDVAIIGGGNSALGAAMQLEKYANKIYMITINDELKGEAVLIDKINKSKKIEIVCCSNITEIKGNVFVESLVIEKDKKEQEIKVGGVFVEIGYISNSEIFNGELNDKKEVIINKKNETSIPGIFAAGDVSDVSVKQIIVAAGEGAKAAINCSEYLNRLE